MENELLRLKTKNKIKKVGVSIYEPSELEFILENELAIDIVQIPFNLFDSRWVRNDLLKRTRNKGIDVFVRSIFVQGLIFIEDDSELDKIDEHLKEYLRKIKKVAIKNEVSMSKLAMDYVKSYEDINGMLVGCETLDQLKENVTLFEEDNVVDNKCKNEILNLTENIPEKIIDPRKWV